MSGFKKIFNYLCNASKEILLLKTLYIQPIMDKFIYSTGLGIRQDLCGMDINKLNAEDFAQAIKDIVTGKRQISHKETQAIVNEQDILKSLKLASMQKT